jgi:UDP-N-acetylmuramyl pentapeptide phosphotransferase/UDP-N-acetylglucosamine-1-phosphate transferase
VIEMAAPRPELLTLSAVVAALVSAGLIMLLRPLLARYALARPNARSSHREPTPQGGGIAVIAATILVIAGLAALAPATLGNPLSLGVLLVATVGLAVLGTIDDIRPLEPAPRLILQAAAVGLVIAALPAELRAVPEIPWWVERAGLLIGGIWFVNLVNFMDGIDWMTVAEVVPITAALVLFGAVGALPASATTVAIALGGAMIGFAPFNKPVARLFLGDVGSLPIGLLLGWMLVLLAGGGHLIAALLLPLYYLADATITLLRRLAKGEPVMKAHRSHFYQRALDNGFSVREIVARVFAVNVLLFALAFSTLLNASLTLHVAAALAGCLLVGLLLISFSRVKR